MFSNDKFNILNNSINIRLNKNNYPWLRCYFSQQILYGNWGEKKLTDA